MISCTNCSKQTKNAKFCSHSCSATYSNLHSQRRRKIRHCRCCKRDMTIEFITSHKYTCYICQKAVSDAIADRKRTFLLLTLGELRSKYEASKVHRSWWYSELCAHARSSNSHRDKKCQVCGYDVHVEYAHIKAISSFGDDATLSEISAECNIALLCPNHHWEFDNGWIDKV